MQIELITYVLRPQINMLKILRQPAILKIDEKVAFKLVALLLEKNVLKEYGTRGNIAIVQPKENWFLQSSSGFSEKLTNQSNSKA